MTNPTIEALLSLQERDARVAALSHELENIPRQLETVEGELEARTEAFEKLRQGTRQIEADRKKLDLEVQAKEGAIARYKAQQTQTRKNEEFAALHHEIEHAQTEISALEDAELELMEAYDKGLAEVAAGEKVLLQAKEKARQKKAELEKRAAHVTTELEEARARQAESEKSVPEEALERYRRILRSKKDVAIVPISSGACGGCHMKLTSQTVLSAKAGEKLIACENCGRIVYWTE